MAAVCAAHVWNWSLLARCRRCGWWYWEHDAELATGTGQLPAGTVIPIDPQAAEAIRDYCQGGTR